MISHAQVVEAMKLVFTEQRYKVLFPTNLQSEITNLSNSPILEKMIGVMAVSVVDLIWDDFIARIKRNQELENADNENRQDLSK